MISKGHTYTLVLASHVKWVLQGAMAPEMRLDFLSHLEKMTDGVITPEVIALVEPMDAKGLELFNEVRKLGFEIQWGPNGRQPDACDTLYKKFDVFASLNPSLQRAYDEACRPWKKSA